MIWPLSSIAVGVAIFPLHRYNPKVNATGSWQKNTLYMKLGQQRDLFYKDKSSWMYLGTYECVGLGILSSNMMDELGPVVRHSFRSRPLALTNAMFTGSGIPLQTNGAVRGPRRSPYSQTGPYHVRSWRFKGRMSWFAMRRLQQRAI